MELFQWVLSKPTSNPASPNFVQQSSILASSEAFQTTEGHFIARPCEVSPLPARPQTAPDFVSHHHEHQRNLTRSLRHLPGPPRYRAQPPIEHKRLSLSLSLSLSLLLSLSLSLSLALTLSLALSHSLSFCAQGGDPPHATRRKTTSVRLSEKTFSTLCTARELALASLNIRWGVIVASLHRGRCSTCRLEAIIVASFYRCSISRLPPASFTPSSVPLHGAPSPPLAPTFVRASSLFVFEQKIPCSRSRKRFPQRVGAQLVHPHQPACQDHLGPEAAGCMVMHGLLEVIHFLPESPILLHIPVVPQIQRAPFHELLISDLVQGKVSQGLQRLCPPARALSEFAQHQQAFFDSSRGTTHVLGFHPIVPHPCSFVKGVFEPSDRGSLSHTQTSAGESCGTSPAIVGLQLESESERTWFVQREIVQVCDCGLDGLFQFVSHRGRVRTPFLFSKVSLFCSLRSLVHSSRCRRHCFLCSVGLLEQVKKDFVRLLPPRGRSLRHYSLFSTCHRFFHTSLLISQSRNAVGTLPWLCQGSWFFHRFRIGGLLPPPLSSESPSLS